MSELHHRPRGVDKIQNDPAHHLAGPFVPPGVNSPPQTPQPEKRQKVHHAFPGLVNLPPRQGIIKDIVNFRWMVVPSSSLKMIMLVVVLWANWQLFTPSSENPFSSFLFISHRVPGSPDSNPLYQKGYLDVVFLLYYVVVFSFIRQSITLYVFQPFAQWWGIRSIRKIERFGEQAYALVYFGVLGYWGIRTMHGLPTWWFNTSEFWKGYPHWQIPGGLKRYYLMQSAYWLQQFLVLVLGLERPRSDFKELVIHHIVTLWLIWWSYLINLTYIGNAVFLSMDVPDSFLALTKLLNYMNLSAKNPVFAVFVVLWTYFRHYLNLMMIKSAWTEMWLMPEWAQKWNPKEGVWFAPWMQYQVIAPIVLLQLVNLFWYVLIWRILIRALLVDLDDERSDDEGDAE